MPATTGLSRRREGASAEARRARTSLERWRTGRERPDLVKRTPDEDGKSENADTSPQASVPGAEAIKPATLLPSQASKTEGHMRTCLVRTEGVQAPIVVAYTCNTKKQKPFFDVLQQLALCEEERFQTSAEANANTEYQRAFLRPILLVEMDLEEGPYALENNQKKQREPLAYCPECWDMVIHKRTDDMVMAQRGDKNAQRRLAALERSFKAFAVQKRIRGRRPVIVDPVDAVWTLTDRTLFSSVLDHLLASEQAADEHGTLAGASGILDGHSSVIRLTKWCAGSADRGARTFSRTASEAFTRQQRTTLNARFGNGGAAGPAGCEQGPVSGGLTDPATNPCPETASRRDADLDIEGSFYETKWGTIEFQRAIPWLQACRLAKMQFPLVVKRRTACGPRSSHDIALVYDEDGLERLLTSEPASRHHRNSNASRLFAGDEVYLQEYVPHGEAVFKIYVLGSEKQVSIHARSTLPIPRGTDRGYRILNTYDFGKCAVSEPQIRATDRIATDGGYPEPPTPADAACLVRLVMQNLHVTLFGLDVLRSIVDGALYVVDLNYFPSFKDVPDAHHGLLTYLRELYLNSTG